jgi:energy-converting hydrogenase Eha subunit F
MRHRVARLFAVLLALGLVGAGAEFALATDQYKPLPAPEWQYGCTAKAPRVLTGSAGSITRTAATLKGTANAAGYSTTVYFQWGTSRTSLTHTTSAKTITGTSGAAVQAAISGLASNTTYYFRAVAKNAYGTTDGDLWSFTTSR